MLSERHGRHLLLAALLAACSEPASQWRVPAGSAGAAGLGGGASGSAGASAAGTPGGASGAAGQATGGASAGSAGTLAGGSGGASAEAGSAGATAEAGAGGAPVSPPPSASKLGESKLPGAGLITISYGGYLNGEAFQQDGIITHKGYQYAAFWNAARHVVLARRALPDGAWSALEFTDYTNSENDAHNTISLGIAPADGTLHLAFDHHESTLHYRRSRTGLTSDPALAEWKISSFGATESKLVGGPNLTQVTYPRFVSVPGGDKLLFSARIGASGSGDELLWEYDATTHAWSALGKYIDGISDSVNAYVHGLAYGRGGQRLHVSWCWRDTSNAATNHDLLYLYSDDHGRSWHDTTGALAGTTGTKAVERDTDGILAWSIGQNRGLINQEHMAIDGSGRVHVLLSHLPDAAPDDASFDSARTKSEYFHYVRAIDGKWTRSALGQPAVAAFRGKLGFAASGNVYAVLPSLRITAASAASGFREWKLLVPATNDRFFSDPLIDAARLLDEDVLSVVYPTKTPDVMVVDFSID
jgi:BNR repeat-containing family member